MVPSILRHDNHCACVFQGVLSFSHLMYLNKVVSLYIYKKYREKGYLLPTWARKITCQRFNWMVQSSSGRKWKMYKQTLLFGIYSHALLRIHVIGGGGQRSVRIASPSLPPHHSSLATREFQSSISVEMLVRGYHLDVQGLLHQQLQSSAMVQYSGLLPVDQLALACGTLLL